MISRFATIFFFLVFGISEFVKFAYADLVLGILALVIAVAMLANA